MKKLLTLLLITLSAFTGWGQGMKFSAYPNTNFVNDTDLLLIAIPGVTNKNITYLQWKALQNAMYILQQGGFGTNLTVVDTFTILGVTNEYGSFWGYDWTGTNITWGFDTNYGGWFGPYAGSNAVNYVVDFAGPSNTITLNNSYWNYSAVEDTAITNIEGITSSVATWATLNVSNSTGGDIVSRLTAPNVRYIGVQSASSMTIPAGKVGMWSLLSIGGLVTNCVNAVQDAAGTVGGNATNYVNQVSNALQVIINTYGGNATNNDTLVSNALWTIANTISINATNQGTVVSNGVAAHTVRVQGTAGQINSSDSSAQALSGNPSVTLSLADLSTTYELHVAQLTNSVYGTNVNMNPTLWVGPSNTVILNNGYQTYVTSGAVSFTNENLTRDWASVVVSNSLGTSITGYCTVPNIRFIGTQSTNALIIPAAKVGIWSFLTVNGMTNCVNNVQQ